MAERWHERRIRSTTALAALVLAGIMSRDELARAQPAAPAPAERHSLWVHPPEIGRTRESVQAFVERARRAHIETLIVLVKGMSGEI
jgi:hypothetical protein